MTARPRGKALVLAAFGARGTGKTAWVRQQLEQLRPPRLLVWDFKHDPALSDLGTAHRQLAPCIEAMRAPSFQLRYLPDHGRDLAQQFELICRAAFLVGNLVLFVDELPEVTKANRAPPAWRRCVNVGRDYSGADGKRRSLSIIGAGQRPAECDKSFIANADVIHSGRLANQADARELAGSIGCDFRELLTLADLEWIERRAGTVAPERGRLTFGKPPARRRPAPIPKH